MTTSSKKALRLNVPVDHIDILKGPGAGDILRLQDSTGNGTDDALRLILFTLSTPASKKTFRKKIHIETLSRTDDYRTFRFSGYLNGVAVHGVYNTQVRKGYFEAS